jgi:glycosyl transferase, family 25
MHLATDASTTARQPAWPCPVFVITMRPPLWSRLQRRLAEWGTVVHRVEGTDGNAIDVAQWIAEGRYHPPAAGDRAMTRGELGCSDSHRRVWTEIVQRDLPGALVLEDDADPPPDLPQWIARAWRLRSRWDLLYLGYNWPPATQPIAGEQDFVVPDIAQAWHVMHAYLVTQGGAQCLLDGAVPIRVPVDVHAARRSGSGLRAWQSVRSVVPTVADTWSSTQGIR